MNDAANDLPENLRGLLYMEHHQSEKRRRMSMHDRAAQFAPFAALTGYEDAVERTAFISSKKNAR